MVKLLAIFLVSLALWGATAQTATPRVILVLWPELQWEDVRESHIWENHDVAMGIMNTRIGGGTQPQGSYLTIGSGSRAYGIRNAERVYHGDESVRGTTAQALYLLRTGETSTSNQPVLIDLAQLLEAAKQARYPLQVGAFGQALADADVTIGAFGNSDTREDKARWAGLVAIDARGVIPRGTLYPDLLFADTDYPFGIRTNYALLLTTILKSDVDVAVVDLGDPHRYNSYQQFMLPKQQQVLRARIWSDAWQFIDQLTVNLPDTKIMVASPYPGEIRARAGQWFAPLLIIGQDVGLLRSATTRWSGIVTNLDVAPTILSSVAIKDHAMVGRTIKIIPGLHGEQLVAQLMAIEERTFQVAKYRGQVLRALVGFQIFLYLISLIMLIVPWRVSAFFVQLLQLSLLISLILPLILLLLSAGWIWPLMATVLLCVMYYRTDHQLYLVAGMALFTALLVIIDVVGGSTWIRFSFFGYDPLGGARFYGIGNEFMGILIGSTIMGWTILRERVHWGGKFLDLLVFVLVTVVIAAPQWGTNVGGGLTAVIGFGVAWLGLQKTRLQLKPLIGLLLLALLGLGALMIFDGIRPEGMQSHIGQTVRVIREQGLVAVLMIIQRKISMNLRLLRYSFWSRGLLAAILAMGASLIWPSSYLQWLVKSHPKVIAGIVGTLAATISAFFLNDSGVVAAATCSFFAATTMLMLALSLKHDFRSSKSDVENDANT